jgi:hypothetical protein
MNRSALKKYAPQARLDFIEAVTQRARRLGLDPLKLVSVEQTGDVLLIGGQPFPVSIAKQRVTLAQRIQQQGFMTVVEALAYTWFNRLVAIRFMELKGYLSHGYRVLGHPQGQQPEILDHVQHLELAGLDKAEVIRLKTAGNQDEALYREILLAQCHELHRNMPFLFEALDDATELLLPDNLLRTDSPIARMVSDIEEGDWEEVEVIGWLYQFYISDKKDDVIGKVVKSEDIPAATQLFTPNWIVQYLVQNSLGRLWLMANPSSALKEKMAYYIEPAEQTPDVQAQLDTLIKVRVDEDGGTLNPESLTILDPACGSGHILLEAYNLLRAIYEERGYRMRDIPRLILQKNLYGLDIDDRATQLAGFALMMKAREDDRRLFDDESNPPHLNVVAIQESTGLPDEDMAKTILDAAIQNEGGEVMQSGQLFGGGQLETLHSSGLTVRDFRELIQIFGGGKTYGSLITVPESLEGKLSTMIDLLKSVSSHGNDLSQSYAAQILVQFALPAMALSKHYDIVVANPPYMGRKGMPVKLQCFVDENWQMSRSDLYAVFVERACMLGKKTAFYSFISMDSWMYGEEYSSLRGKLLDEVSFLTLAHLGPRAFPEINGEVVQTVAFIFVNEFIDKCKGSYFDLTAQKDTVEKAKSLMLGEQRYDVESDLFRLLPRRVMAYAASESTISAFADSSALQEFSEALTGLQTGDNDAFLRYWFEVDFDLVSFGCKQIADANNGRRWFPYVKGSEFKKWYGNQVFVVNWEGGGAEIRAHRSSTVRNSNKYFNSGISYNNIAKSFCARYVEEGYIFDQKNSMFFSEEEHFVLPTLGYLNSKVVSPFLKVVAPKDFNPGSLKVLPVKREVFESSDVSSVVAELVSIAKRDWDLKEISWGFTGFGVLGSERAVGLLGECYEGYSNWLSLELSKATALEVENNKNFIRLFGLEAELSPEVSPDVVTLSRAERNKDMRALISYVIGCMMGRYSLDEEGLIYARSGGIGFDRSRYLKFPADIDGIVPITEEFWFEDDPAERVREFLMVVWGEGALQENMEWLANSLGRKVDESAGDSIRRYLSSGFYKDHLHTYKKRPIYWLFSSGKQKAFECLVYLHRYNEGTLSRMRMEYVVPLQGRMQARIDKLADDINSATGSAQQKALQKRKDKLTKQLEELRRFDETLRPYADQRIALNLDDGVKVNYGKFGDLLAEVKVITGGKED